MTKTSALRLALVSVSVLSLSGCGLASLPGGYTPIEKQTVSELSGANYTPRTADERAAIKTQELFAQAAFWSREYDLNPADLEAAINLASTLRRLGNPSKSVEITTQTRALYPRDVDLMTELAAAHIGSNEPQKAIKIIDEALNQRPQTARLWSMKGAVMDQMEMFTQARQYYAKAMQLAPNDSGIMANVGLSYALEGDPRTAEVWLRRAANAPGASPTVRQNLALVLGLQGKNEEAQTWASRDLDATAAKANANYMSNLRGAQNTNTAQHQQTHAPQTQPAQRRTGPARTRRGAAQPQTRTQQHAPQTPPQARVYGYAVPQTQRQKQYAATQQTAPRFTEPKQHISRQQAYRPTPPQQHMPKQQIAPENTQASMPQFAGGPKSIQVDPRNTAETAPMSVLDKIARNNQSKLSLAYTQQAQLQARAQQRAAHQQAQQQQQQAQHAYQPQMPNTMQPYQAAPQYQPYAQYGAPQQMQQQQSMQGQPDPRRAARSRRR